MIWRLRTFAVLRDRTGQAELEVELPDGASVRELKSWVAEHYPTLANGLAQVRVAADYEFLAEDDALPPGAELALIPPVSGGSEGTDESVWVELTPSAVSLDAAMVRVRGPDAGAAVTFEGCVRGTSRGGTVQHLEYEAYPEMALIWLRRIARRALDEHGALRAVIHHRVGRVGVGEASVVIAVAAAHRNAAFAAARAIIEALKADVPIWKREVLTDGAVWVGWGS